MYATVSTTVTTISQDTSSTDYGVAPTFTATVTPDISGPSSVTGMVQFDVDATPTGSPVAVDANGNATWSPTDLTLGTHSVTVDYLGSTYFIASSSTSIDHTVTSPSTTTVTADVEPSEFGQSVTFTATVAATAPGAATPTGSVQFSLDSSPVGSSVTLNGSAQATWITSSLDVGSHTVSAAFTSSDPLLDNSVSADFNQEVDPADTTTLVASDSGGTSVYGQGVTFTATVSASLPGSGTPAGSVQFSVDSSPVGSAVTLNGVGQATSASISDLSVGSHTITASYGGNTDFNASSDNTGASQTVNKADTTTAITNGPDLGTGTVVGQSYTVQWSVTVNSPGDEPGASAPTGTVTVTGGSGCSADVTAGQCDVTSTEHGSKSLIATYSGDGNFNTSASDSSPHDVNLDDTSTVVTLATGTNPSVHGQSVSFQATVTVTGAGAGTPTGSVQFKIDGTDFGSPVTLSGGQATSDTTSSLSTQGHSISAVYSGDTEDNGSTSGSFTQTVNKSDTSSSVQSSINPSVHGQSVSFTATVSASGAGAGTPTGLVQFKIDGVNFGGAVSLSGGQATSGSISSLTTAGHSITVVYGGDSDFNGSDNTGSPLTQTVNKANTATTMGSASVNPSVHGQAVTFTATVAANAPGGGIPTGMVQFKVDNVNLGSPVALNGSGQATSPATSSLTTGSHSVRAYYLGSADFNTSHSAALTQNVGKASTSSTISGTPNPSRFGKSFTLSTTVTVVLPGSGVVRGKVQFYIDGSKFDAPVKLSHGHASVTVNITLTRGTHTIQARYLGNGAFIASISPVVSHQVTH